MTRPPSGSRSAGRQGPMSAQLEALLMARKRSLANWAGMGLPIYSRRERSVYGPDR